MALIKCTKCGQEISDKTRKCVNCGEIVINERNKIKICVECGKENPIETTDCVYCGCPFNDKKISKNVKKIIIPITVIALVIIIISCIIYAVYKVHTQPMGVSTTEEIVEGNRENPYAIGAKEDIRFWGYSIQSYGYANIGIVDYADGEITLECSLDKYGNSNPLRFSVDFDWTYYENNRMIYVYPCDDPKTFTVSKYDEYIPVKDVEIPCGEKETVKYKIDESKRYVAVVYYSMLKDGTDYTNGKYDFIDTDLYGHILFYDLDK